LILNLPTPIAIGLDDNCSSTRGRYFKCIN
jgi:hypothetical protein